MAVQRLSSSPFAADAFASTQSFHGGAKQVDGGTALAMASIDLMMALAPYGPLKQHQ
jgi:hypothetical protein